MYMCKRPTLKRVCLCVFVYLSPKVPGHEGDVLESCLRVTLLELLGVGPVTHHDPHRGEILVQPSSSVVGAHAGGTPVLLQASLALLRDPLEQGGLSAAGLAHQHQLHAMVRTSSA